MAWARAGGGGGGDPGWRWEGGRGGGGAPGEVLPRDAPGYAETIRQESRDHTPLGILTRGVSGIRGRTLIVNFPGSPKAIGQSWPVVEPTLKHAADTLERE